MNYSIIDKDIQVTLSDDTYEGHSGDYNPNDPNDELLLRFDVYQSVNDEWIAVDNASYCTRIPASTQEEKINVALNAILKEVAEPIRNGYSVKKTCERLSWIHPSEL